MGRYSILDKYSKDDPYMDRQPYIDKVLSIGTANQITYLPMNEEGGVVATDLSVGGNNGTYVGGVTLGEPGIGDGQTCAAFDGATGYVDLASVIGDLDPGNFSFNIWFKIRDWTTLTDAGYHHIFRAYTDANNAMYFCKADTAYSLGFRYIANAVDITRHVSDFRSLYWMALGVVVDGGAGTVTYYCNGRPIQAAIGGIGVWAGALSYVLLGSFGPGAVNTWDGWLAHFLLVDGPLTTTQMAMLGRID